MSDANAQTQRDAVAATVEKIRSLNEHISIDKGRIRSAWGDVLYPELELRVGERLSAGLSQNQLDKFEELLDSDDSDGPTEWLRRTIPNYRITAKEELELLVESAATWFINKSGIQTKEGAHEKN